MQKRIVIADDDPTMRSALGEALSSTGYNTVVFPNGADAELYLKESGADLVVTDINEARLKETAAAIAA